MPAGEKNQEMKQTLPRLTIDGMTARPGNLLCALILSLFMWGCTVTPQVEESAKPFAENTVVSARLGGPVAMDELWQDLKTCRIIYVGEQHTNPAHHQVQLQIIQAAYAHNPNLTVGMEMFDFTYQDVLDLWSAGQLDEKTFLRKTHWYANWRYDYALYRDILSFIKEHQIRLIGLNIPSHVTKKIRVGGLLNLGDEEKKLLPQNIDLSYEAHREHIKEIFDGHKQHFKGDAQFDDFYAAQVVWEDTMAERIAENWNDGTMVVLAGNGHIQFKYGIPDRAYKQTGAAFCTIYTTPIGSEVDLDIADYIWVTE